MSNCMSNYVSGIVQDRGASIMVSCNAGRDARWVNGIFRGTYCKIRAIWNLRQQSLDFFVKMCLIKLSQSQRNNATSSCYATKHAAKHATKHAIMLDVKRGA